MSNQLTASDCHYIQQIIADRLINVRRGYGFGGQSEVDYIETLITRMSVLEDQLNEGESQVAQLREDGPFELEPPVWFGHNAAIAWSCGRAVGWNDALDSVVEVG